jgi:hypothetical protein
MSEMGGERGDLFLGSIMQKRESLEFNGNCSSGKTSVGVYQLKEAIEKFYGDLLVSHRRKCDCALAGMATWRLFSRRKVMESQLMGTEYKPL